MKNIIENIEEEIDQTFANNQLAELPYNQAMWTILSTFECRCFYDLMIKCIQPINDGAYVDSVLNDLTHPLRVIFKRNNKNNKNIIRNFNTEQYGQAVEWLTLAKDYNLFNTIFPLWRKEKIKLQVEENKLVSTDWRNQDFRFEAYHGINKAHEMNQKCNEFSTAVFGEVLRNTIIKNNDFEIKLNPKLVKSIVDTYMRITNQKFYLPENWKTAYFSFGEFKMVYITLQSILIFRSIVRDKLSESQIEGWGYASIVWLVDCNELSSDN